MPKKPTPRRSDTPSPGFYLLRLVRNGPYVGAQIRHEDGQWFVMEDGVLQGPSTDPWLLPLMERVHHYGRETTEAEVRFRLGLKRFEEIYKPDGSAANPRKPIDLDKMVPF